MRHHLLLLALVFLSASYSFGQSSPIFQYKKPLSVNSNLSRGLTDLKSDLRNRKGDTTTLFSNCLKQFLTDTALYQLSSAEMAYTFKKTGSVSVSILKNLREGLRNTRDSATRSQIQMKIDSIKLQNTNEFLSGYGYIHPFRITDIGKYDVDSLNKFFYDQKNVSAFQSISIQHAVDPDDFINAEFASFLFGPVRMGVEGSFKTSGDTTKDAAIKSSLQKILYSGGAINFNFSLPLFFCRDRKDQVHFGIFGQINNGLNPGISDSTGGTNFSTNALYITQILGK